MIAISLAVSAVGFLVKFFVAFVTFLLPSGYVALLRKALVEKHRLFVPEPF